MAKKKKRRGCLGCGCLPLLFLGASLPLAIVIIVIAGMFSALGTAAQTSNFDHVGLVATNFAKSSIPSDQLKKFQDTASGSERCGIPWTVLAAVAKRESEFGTNPGMHVPHDGGVLGYGQFQPGTWAAFGTGDIYDFRDAIPAINRYLCYLMKRYSSESIGVTTDEAIKHALFSYSGSSFRTYNPGDSYIIYVMEWARKFGVEAPTIDLSRIGGWAGDTSTLTNNIGGHQWTIAFGFKAPYDHPFNVNIPIHRGVDLIITGAVNNGRGQPYLAFYPGVVEKIWPAAEDLNGGNGIVVYDDKNKLYHRYFHSDAVAVKVGQTVTTSTVLGILGASGTEGFPHLHYEVAKNIIGDPICCLVDPQPFLRGQVPLP